ncbi:MAG: hypothetical protein K8W52_34295 [Deltaproteobacteria bacterium]|nr:hypothetical protein [Deltaproteobacteria bacterium]
MSARGLAVVALLLALVAGCVRVVDLTPDLDANVADAAFILDTPLPDAAFVPVPDAAPLPDGPLPDA